ncbi:MAG: type I-B CRISPR-associated protein Cas8b1/Cst1 [Anaerolineales bacterium]|jgi:CRISPR-associated protein Cst1
MKGIDYTGHPLFDVGLATLTAFAGKKHPSQLTEEDLSKAAQYMETNYVVDPLKSFLTVAFPNSGFNNPAFEAHPEKRYLYAQKILGAFLVNQPHPAYTDPFSGEPATAIPYDIKGELPPGRAFRQHIPLLTAEDMVNFHAEGEAGLPLSGFSLLVFHALPLGCAKVGGRLLAVHCDDSRLMLHFAKSFLGINQKHIVAARAANEKKLADTSTRQPRTLLIEQLLEAELELQNQEHPTGSLTAYYFTNSGQGVELQIIPLPFEVSRFLRHAISPRYQGAWQALVERGWQLTRKGGAQPRYNRLYEDLFTLPLQSVAFIRRYFLRKPSKSGDKTDPTTTYNPRAEANLISWALAELFLKEVMLMERERIDAIRRLGDSLAEYIVRQNDRRFFNAFWLARSYSELRAALIRTSLVLVRQNQPPLIGFDEFLAVFELSEGIPNADWRLGRDLVLIRLMERLYQEGWLAQHLEAVPEEIAAEESAEETM